MTASAYPSLRWTGWGGEGNLHTASPFHETWGQTSHCLQFQVQRYYCSNQYYWSCQGSNTLKQTSLKTKEGTWGREYSRWGNMYPVMCWSWLVTSWARWLAEVLKNFQPSWYCIGSLVSHGGNIDTMEMGKHYKSKCGLLLIWLLSEESAVKHPLVHSGIYLFSWHSSSLCL